MLYRNAKVAIAALVAVAMAGCGGSGDSASLDTSATRLSLTASEGFNGSLASIRTSAASTTTVDGHLVSTVTDDGRTITVDFPETSLESGDTFYIGDGGATVTYTEAASDGTHRWTATSGQVSLTGNQGGNTATLQVDGVTFTPSEPGANGATGSFSLDGDIAGIPITGSGAFGGATNLTFSGGGGSNANVSAFSDASVVFNNVGGTGGLTATTGTGTNTRVFNVSIASNVAAGQTVALTDLSNSKVTVTFTQGEGTGIMTWVGTSGSVTVLQKTATSARVRLNNVTFTPLTGDASATGSFVVNGTITER